MLADAVRAVAIAFVGPVWYLPLQSLDPSIVTEAPATARAAASFLLTILFGGAVIYRDGGRIESAVEASRQNPFVSVVYGLMAFAIVTFFVAYALSQLSNLGVGGSTLGIIGALLLGVALLTLGGLGFAVVGAWATESFGGRDPWAGLVGVGAISAAAWLILPFGLSVVVWLGIAAVGLGGPTRRWVHSSGPAPSGE